MEAVAKALTIHPMLNISVDGSHIIKYKSINLGMATALADESYRTSDQKCGSTQFNGNDQKRQRFGGSCTK